MKASYSMALMLGLAALDATSLEAAEIANPTDEITNSVRVVNSYLTLVRVYAEDAQGRLHTLGSVARGELKEFEIPEEIAKEDFRIKVVPWQPLGLLQQDDFGVKTNPIDIGTYSEVTVWLQPDLRRSVVATVRS